MKKKRTSQEELSEGPVRQGWHTRAFYNRGAYVDSARESEKNGTSSEDDDNEGVCIEA